MKVIIVLFLGLALLSCQKEDNNIGTYKPKFVVEGWIEDGEYPHVILTHNLPFFTAVDSAQLNEVVIRWAKVSVSDGEETEILTAGKDSRYFPPYIYKGNSLKGESGKTYTLKVEYAGYTLTSSTYIPKKNSLDSIWFTPKNDSLRQLNIKFTDDINEKNYYRLFTRVEKDDIFYPTLIANQNDKFFNGKQLTLQVNKGPKNNLSLKNQPYYKSGDTVYVKFSCMSKEGYDFWSSFNDEILNSSNPLVGSTGVIKHNIEGQGIGVWCGYGSNIYRIIAK